MVHPGIHILDDFLRNNIYDYISMSRSNFIYVTTIRFSSERYIAMHV